ncbi:hypothetical protein, partial [Nocardioides kribbensis]|uniref:hypothetical protein n=1 Tax=Nocardioides kribbensis TaxID=305517 RepID=UPI0032DA2DAF
MGRQQRHEPPGRVRAQRARRLDLDAAATVPAPPATLRLLVGPLLGSLGLLVGLLVPRWSLWCGRGVRPRHNGGRHV